jgi:copper resistance protein B
VSPRGCILYAVVLGSALFSPAITAAQTMPGSTPRTTSMELDRKIRVYTLADLLEYVPAGKGSIRADGLAWIGGDYNRVYLRLDGEQPFGGSDGETDIDIAYGRLVSPFWTALLGGRIEMRGFGSARRNTRGLLALGFEGLAPYWLEMEPTLYVSSKGQVSGRFATSVDLLFTQRLILQPRIETNFAIQKVPELGIGSGVNDIELGARMRYEIRREFAPYVGLVWFRVTGGAAPLARRAGEPIREAGLVAGVRMWH